MQSTLLQSVRNAIISTFPRSNVHADGQVVVIDFTDGIKFEVLPAIKNDDFDSKDGIYFYPDSHQGGKWLSTDPEAEITSIKDKNEKTKGLLIATCKHIRGIRDRYFSDDHISGIVIDAFLYHAIGNWMFVPDDKFDYEQNVSYLRHLLNYFNRNMTKNKEILAPGSNCILDTNSSYNVLGEILNKMAL